jgi:DNA-binding transcriptional LysR family regulator
MTLHQLRIFMAVAQSTTLTRASKQLGLAQPSLSQQLAKLEESVGTRLFDRSHNRMVLTDAGQVLMRHAQAVLKEIEEAEANLARFGTGKRSIIRIAGLNSVIKAVLPDALTRCAAAGSDIEIDIHEAAPAEVLEMLYSRQANVGLIAADSVAQSSVGFRQVPVVDDPYVFAVPSALKLGKVRSTRCQTRPVTSSTVVSSSTSARRIRCASSSGTSRSSRSTGSSLIAAPTRWRSGWSMPGSAFACFRRSPRSWSRARSTASTFSRPTTAQGTPWRWSRISICASRRTRSSSPRSRPLAVASCCRRSSRGRPQSAPLCARTSRIS